MTLEALTLAAFISPALFLGGAGAVAAPILIHLLARRRFKRIRWAAMEFLIDAERRNRRRIRMEEWILLLLRCLAVLFIAFLVARPFIRPSGAAALFGGATRTERVFVIDDSLSMAYQVGDETVFSRAKQAVRRVLESVRRESPDDTATVLRMTAPTTPIDSGTFLDDTQTQQLLARLEALSPSQQSVDPSRVIEGVVEVLERNPDVTHAAVYIISDFQRNHWVPPDAGGDPEGADGGILSPFAAWAKTDRGLHLVLVNVGVDDAANVALTKLSLRGGRLVAGTTGTVQATIVNFSQRPRENIELQLSIGAMTQPSKTIRRLSAGQSASVELEAEFVRAGEESVRVEIPPDALSEDNVRYATADVAEAIRVLVVNGEPSSDAYDDEVTFLATALRPEGEIFSGNEVVVVDEAAIEETNLANFHVVLLANVYRVSEPAVESLERFVRRGGGLLVFLGDQVDADLYNTAMYREGEGLLPARLTELIRAPEASHLVVTDRLHPAMRGLSIEGDPLGIGQIPFLQYLASVTYEVPDDETEADEAAVSARAARPGRVIARFDDADENPAIIERGFGRGRVVLMTTAVDKEWHGWPDHPTFLPVMMELVRHVARRSDGGTEYWAGDTIELPLDPALFEPDVIVRGPAYPNEREVGLTAAPAGDGRGLLVTWEHANRIGLYRFLLKRREGAETVRLVAVNVDPLESDLATAEEDELRQSLRSVPFEYIKGIDKLSGAAGEARTELWRLFLFAAAMVLMMEQGLAWWWGRRH